MAQTIGEAYINIMPSAENFGSGLQEALGGVAKTAGAAIGATFATGVAGASALTDAVSDLAKSGDEIDKASQKLGVSAEFYQEWDAVLQHSGTSMDSMTSTFKTLANAVQDGSDDQVAAFEALGLSMDELQNMSTEEVFEATISALQDMEEGTERTALATDLLGKGAMELGPLMNTSAEDTQAMIDTVHELGGVLSDDTIAASAQFQDNLQDLQTAMGGLKNSMLSEFLPGFNQVLAGLTAFLSGDQDGLAQVTDGIQTILDNATSMLPQFLDLAMSIIEGLASAIIDNLPQLMETGFEIISSIGDFILENLPMLLETALEILVQLANDISEQLPTLIPAIVDVMLTIVDTLIENIDMLVDASITLITALAEGLINALPTLVEKAPEIIIKLVEALVENIPKLVDCALELIVSLGGGLIDALPELAAKVPEIITCIVDGLLDMISDIGQVGKDLVEGLWNGISDMSDWIIEKIQGFGDDILEGIKSFFGIASPSKVFRDEVGQWLPKGMAVGIEANADSVTKAMNMLAKDTLTMGTSISADMMSMSYTSSGMVTTDDSKVLNLLTEYLPIIARGQNVEIALQGDTDRLFTAIQRKSRVFKKQTGSSAFA